MRIRSLLLGVSPFAIQPATAAPISGSASHVAQLSASLAATGGAAQPSPAVRIAQNKVELIVDYDGWFGWQAHPVAVPIEVVGIQGRDLARYAAQRTAPAWQQTDETAIPDDDSVKIVLSKLRTRPAITTW
jgi:hypothetical protein